jgi:hypothetical protein
MKSPGWGTWLSKKVKNDFHWQRERMVEPDSTKFIITDVCHYSRLKLESQRARLKGKRCPRGIARFSRGQRPWEGLDGSNGKRPSTRTFKTKTWGIGLEGEYGQNTEVIMYKPCKGFSGFQGNSLTGLTWSGHLPLQFHPKLLSITLCSSHIGLLLGPLTNIPKVSWPFHVLPST